METAPDWEWDKMRPWSKAVFRKDHRLAVAVVATVARPRELYAQAIADRLGLEQAEVRGHLRDFEAAGLLKKSEEKGPVSGAGGRPAALYARTEDEFWTCLAKLGDRFRR